MTHHPGTGSRRGRSTIAKLPLTAVLALVAIAAAGCVSVPTRTIRGSSLAPKQRAAIVKESGTPAAPGVQPSTPPGGRRVLALYYPWYGTPKRSGKWVHYSGVDESAREIGSHAHYPALGPYDSSDPAVVDAHLDQAKAAGIDTLVCSWWGRSDATDRAIRLLLARAPAHGMTACVYWERPPSPANSAGAARELSYIVNTLARLPGYLHQDGKPVVFAYAPVCSSMPAGAWSAVQREARGWTGGRGVLLIGSSPGPESGSAWGGWHTLAAEPSMVGLPPEAAARMQRDVYFTRNRVAHAQHRLCVATVTPGHDDRKHNRTYGIRGAFYLDRWDGRLYEALWQQALMDGADWVLIDSFNQWHAGTEIEPSADLGDLYLTLTAENAAKFKGQTPQRALDRRARM